jgi:hypothetical protein
MAETATMSKPIQASSLHRGPLDMVAYWVPLEDDGYEVTATFISRASGAEPMRVVMRLDEGDDVAFAMPGHRTMLYKFARANNVVSVSADRAGVAIAAR